MKAHDDLTFNVIGATMAHDDLTFNVIGATMESPSQNPLACLYKPRVCGNKAELLRRNPCCVLLFVPRGGVGLVDSRLTSPQEDKDTACGALNGKP